MKKKFSNPILGYVRFTSMQSCIKVVFNAIDYLNFLLLSLQVCKAHISSMVEALLLGKVVNRVQIIDEWFSSFTVASPKLYCCMLADTRSFSLACDIDILSNIIPCMMQKDHSEMSTFHVIWVALTHIFYVQNSPFAQH
ncbi:hypothetical protein VPH35_104573 [Triticum aestivum]